MITRPRDADTGRPARQPQNAEQTRAGEKTAVEYEKPPGLPGGFDIVVQPRYRKALSAAPTCVTGVRIEFSVFCHCTKGASVT